MKCQKDGCKREAKYLVNIGLPESYACEVHKALASNYPLTNTRVIKQIQAVNKGLLTL